MNVNVNPYLNQISYATASAENASMPHGDVKKNESKSGSNKDTVTISIAGQLFTAERRASDSNMGSLHITSDLDSFRNALKSTNEPLPVDWDKVVDPYNTFTNAAKIESRLKQLADPTASHKDDDMERVAEAYAKSKIDILIEKKKAMQASGTAKSNSEEYAEYETAYNAYHSENGAGLIAAMSADAKKAYHIYKNIIDGASIPIDDEEYLMLHNRTMYIGAKSEHIRITEEKRK